MAKKKETQKSVAGKAGRNKGGKRAALDKVSQVKEEAASLANPKTESVRKPAVGHSVILDHRVLWQDVRERFLDGLKSGDEAKLKAAKLAGDGLLNIVKGERQAWGLFRDDIEPLSTDIREIVEEMDRATSCVGEGKALERG